MPFCIVRDAWDKILCEQLMQLKSIFANLYSLKMVKINFFYELNSIFVFEFELILFEFISMFLTYRLNFICKYILIFFYIRVD